jgi:hypothetical protein
MLPGCLDSRGVEGTAAVITIPNGCCVSLAIGHSDMRNGFHGDISVPAGKRILLKVQGLLNLVARAANVERYREISSR